MMRVLVIVLSFLTLTFGLLLLQPAADTAINTPQETAQVFPVAAGQVTRGQTELLQIATAPIRQPEPQPVSSGRNVAVTQPEKPTTRAVVVPDQQVDELRSMTNGILAGLGIATTDPAQEIQVASLTNTATDASGQRAMTNNVLSGLRAATGKSEGTETLQTIIVQALQAGESDAYIDALLNAAKIKGEIQVPEALVTNTGKVDTSVILASIIQGATGEPAKPTASVGGPGVEVRVVQHINGTVQYQFYTVQSGDSLGAIAIKFYGDMREYKTIYEANRQVIVSPDRIRAGQRLSIPAL
ncbi:MAG: LysM peptidoglycan-binding domain-containing protein [Rhodobacterales bacterium]|nr:LysM peptidoglycan-binding domain-containing protein [Rhodobacterales bacterium]